MDQDSPDVRRPTRPANVQGRRSRFAASEVTFGPLGRIVATILVVGVLWWVNAALGIFGVVIMAIYAREFLPSALKDIWRPVRLPPDESDVIKARFEAMRLEEQPPAPPESPIAERPVPQRW